jgi:hypothetical protein
MNQPPPSSPDPTPQHRREAADLASEGRRQIDSLIDRQKGRAADALDDFVASILDAAHRLEEGGQVVLARSALSMARRADRVSRYVRDTELGDMLDDAALTARRHPAAFLASTFAAGLLLGRIARSSGHHSYLEA